jgi:trafficking protein particle complex subunit 6
MATTASTSVSSSLATLSDPPTRTVDGPVVDYFVIEMVNTLRASSAVAVARAKKIEQEMIEAGLLSQPQSSLPAVPSKRDSAASTSSKAAAPEGKVDEEEEALRLRLESIGTHVGANVAERSSVFYIVSSPRA